jgi:hypothetical protein
VNSYGDTVMWVVATLVDGYGGRQVYDWDNGTRTTLAASVQPLSSREIDAGRQVATTDKTMLCPYVAMEAQHRVEWRGQVWRIEGEPEQHHQQGRPDHLEVHLVRVTEPG